MRLVFYSGIVDMDLEPTSAAIDRPLLRWRERATTMLLAAMGLLGVPLVLVFVGPLLEDRSYGTLAFSVFLVVADLFFAWRRSLLLPFRSAWAVFNMVSAGVPELFLGGDRAATAGMFLGAVFLGVVLLGWRVVVGLVLTYTVLLAVTAWGHARGALPHGQLVVIDWNTPQGWLGMWAVIVFVAVLSTIAAEMMVRQLQVALQEQQADSLAREQTLQELVHARQASVALSERVDSAVRTGAALERALADTLSAVRAGFWETDLTTGAASWSDGMYPLLGYEPGEVEPSAASWRERTHPDDHARMMAGSLESTFSNEYRVIWPDGQTRVLRSQMSTVYDDDGTPVRLRGIVTDVTAERQTALQLQRLAEVASRTGNPVIFTDLEGRIEWVNEAFTRMSGWHLEEVLGKTPGAVLRGPLTDAAASTMMRAAIAARQPFECEVLNHHRNGRQYWIHIEARVRSDDEGNATGFIAVESDVTERRLADSRDALAQRIASILLTADTIQAAIQAVTQELVRELDIRVAQLWLVEPGNPQLVWVAGAAAATTGDAGPAFLAFSSKTPFFRGLERIVGVGIPGVAWGTGRAFVLDDFTGLAADGRVSRRVDVATAAGVATFCATPIRGPDGVLGVLEVGGTRNYPGHELLPSLLERVAEQLATFILHDVSRRAYEAVFDRSPDGLVLVGADGNVLDANVRAHAMFGEQKGARVDALIDGGLSLVHDAFAAPVPTGESAASSTLFNRPAHGAAGAFSAEVSVSVAPSSTKQVAILSVRDLTERRRMEEALNRSLREKDTLLREVHHRVKNNLQIVSSLLSMQSDSMEEGAARTALLETVFRVRSMSYVHQQLYGTDGLDIVDLGAYTHTLAMSLQGSLDVTARLTFSLAKVEVSIDRAMPCGLVLNELLTNALKHGRSADGRCDIDIGLSVDGGGFALTVRDRGPGLPTHAPQSNSLGMQLIRTLTRQIRGRLVVESDGGARVTIHVPSTT